MAAPLDPGLTKRGGFSPRPDEGLIDRLGGSPSGFEQLSRREREVLLGLMRGSRAKEISQEMFISLPTVRSQIRSVLLKLGVRSQLAAVALAYQTGWPRETSFERMRRTAEG